MKMNYKEWHKGLVEWMLKECIPEGDPEKGAVPWKCKDCQVDIEGKEKIISLHDPRFTLAGYGETRRIVEPFCPRCKKHYGVPPFLDYDLSEL